MRNDDPPITIDSYPRIIVAGTHQQEDALSRSLSTLVEITPKDLLGRDEPRPVSFEGATLSNEHTFNRGLPITARKLFGRRREIETLRKAWASEQTRVASVVAYGGTGKSALVNAWLREMKEHGYGGAQKVYAWSFYSQGTRENLVSADPFINHALDWLGERSASLDPSTRGRQLASLIKKHRFLLVLDGLEPLQQPLKAEHVSGQLTDASIRALLEALAEPDWEGLCLVTTRVPVTDLRRFQSQPAGPANPASVVQLDLENLNERDAADLLRELIRVDAEFADLQEAVRAVDGHALAVTLLGNYLRDVHGGDLAGRFGIERLTVDAREGGHARRIMASYSKWLERNERLAELAILRLIGLFDRPAPARAMSALVSEPRLVQFSGQVGLVGGEAWNGSVDALREMGLLNRPLPEEPGTLDAHPLVREHFRDLLREHHDYLWWQGNRTLFEYYQGQAEEKPENAEEMNKLYTAVTHGCAAGLQQEVFDNLLLPRVWHDRRRNFSTRRLGMVSSDLVALSNYFHPRQWVEFRRASLSAPAQILILTNAGVRLRQLGRLAEARQCFAAVVRQIDPQSAQPQELEDASYAATAHSELLVVAGKLTGPASEPDNSLFNGRRAIEYSDRGKDPYFSMHARSSLAETYFMLDDLATAASLFDEAMAIERERDPRPPFLYSQGLFRYGYFLIETGRAASILHDAARDPAWGTNGEDTSLLSKAIRLLVLGAAHRALTEEGRTEPAFQAGGQRWLDDAISAFETAGYVDYTVRGLLERARFYRVRNSAEYFARALADLTRASYEARRGQMDLLYADILLEQAACLLNLWPTMTNEERSEFRSGITGALNEAARMISAFGYARRQAMAASLRETAEQVGVLE